MQGSIRTLLLPAVLLVLAALVSFLLWSGGEGAGLGPPMGLEPESSGQGTSADLTPVDSPESQPAVPAGATGLRTSASGAASDSDLTGELTAVTGSVVSEPVGRPVEGALVVLRDALGEASTRTRADGSFVLQWGRPAPGLVLEHESYVDARLPLDDLSEPVEIRLVRSGELAGRVIALTGSLPSEAHLHLWSEVRGKRSETPAYSAELEPTGLFAFADVPPGTYALGMVEPGIPLLVKAGVLVQSGQTTRVNLELPYSAEVHGLVVLGVSRLPVEGATVRCQPEVQGLGNDMEERASFEVLTGSDGTFRLKGVPTGEVDLWARTPWGHRQRGTAQAIEGKEGRAFRFVIAAPATLSGVVRNGEGDAVPGALVLLCLADEASHFSFGSPERLDLDDVRLRSAVADSAGKFDFGLVPGRHKLHICGYAPGPDGGWMLTGLEVPASEVFSLQPDSEKLDMELVLREGWPVSGVVRDQDGQPLAGVQVVPKVRMSRSWARWGAEETDLEGRFHFVGLPAGPVSLELQLEGYLPERVRSEVAADSDELEVELLPAFQVTGVVVDAAGYAIPNARALARLDDEERRRRRSVATDEFGRFTLTDLEEGSWTVLAGAPGWELPEADFRTLILPGENAPQQLVLYPIDAPALASVTGELRRAVTGEPIPGLRFNSLRRGTVERSGTRFQIRGMLPGRLRLVALGDKIEPYPFPTQMLAPGAELDLGSVELRGVADTLVRVVGPDGKPHTKARVWFQRIDVERDGRPFGPQRLKCEYSPKAKAFTFQGLPRYRWSLEVRADGFQSFRREVRAKGNKASFQVQLKPRKRR